jgi:DNA-binding transcriptional ArsR family regulator
MDARTHDLLTARAKILKALAHPTRLFIVNELAAGERCVCELQRDIGADLSTVSKHLSVLKNAGLITDEKRGLQVFYRLHCPCILNFISCIENVIQENARRHQALVGAHVNES